MDDLKVRFISPSSFYYWEKCPMKAVFYKKYKNVQIFPRHPDADLGSIIHSFFENKIQWGINNSSDFERKWRELLDEVDRKYKESKFQRIYYPIAWHSKFFAVKKALLRQSLLLDREETTTKSTRKIKFEKWIDDEKDVGGYVDLIIYDDQERIIEIVDFKTGKIYELNNERLEIKPVYKYQLALYSKIIFKTQSWFPKTYLQDMTGKRHLIDIDDKFATSVYNKAVNLKRTINSAVETGNIDSLAVANPDNCSFCDYRPHCTSYKTKLINNFDTKNVDVFCQVEDILPYSNKLCYHIIINEKEYRVKNMNQNSQIDVGDNIYIYNLFYPDDSKNMLYSTKNTSIY